MSSSNSTSTMMSMSSMMMVFYTSTSTPLYSASWIPSGTGQYAGTCIFLIVLAAIFRGLLSLKAMLQRKWLQNEVNRRYVSGSENVQVDGRAFQDGGMEKTIPVRTEDGAVVRNGSSCLRPWRISTEGPRAILDTVIAGVAYLL